MAKKKVEYKYLLQQYLKVDNFLVSENASDENLPDIIISFCTVVEKILKIKLYKRNPLLIFDVAKFKEDDALCIVSKKKEKEIETIKIQQLLGRFKLIFNKVFSEEELAVLKDLYDIRNFFIHSYKPDTEASFDSEDIIKKMGTIWDRISTQAVVLFGKGIKKAVEPKKKYSEAELEQVLMREVAAKIRNDQNLAAYPFRAISAGYTMLGSSGSEICPRCRNNTFSFEPFGYSDLISSPASSYSALTLGDAYLGKFSDLYRCSVCNLELTKKEYEIAKRIMTDGS